MRRLTLFEVPPEFTSRIDALKEDLGHDNAELLLQVELGFALMELLRLDDEPITALWAILSAMPLRHPRLQSLDQMERQAIANARQIVPFSGRFAWLGALRAYITIAQRWRNYDFQPENLELLICNAKQLRHQNHQELYERCLSANLQFRTRDLKQVEVETTYQFEARTETETSTVMIAFSPEQLDRVTPPTLPWFSTLPVRTSMTVHIRDLEPHAAYLDERERVLARRYGWDETERGNWVKRYRKIKFHGIQEDSTLGEENATPLKLDGFTHIGGMVASGKSTFSQLLIVHILQNYPDRRITLVVGNVQSAIQLANQINWWFCEDPENDQPVAVPLLGRSKRDTHLRGLRASKDYQNHWKRNQPHWGDRWLGTACLLQGLLSSNDIINRLGGKPLKPGTEPCHALKKAPQNDREQRRKSVGASYLCPFFANCPSQQVYRDMPIARVWITTPGAMSMAGLPRHLELRPFKLGEMINEQSHDIIFDEVDTIINWFDNVYAEEVILTNSNNGVLDVIGVPTEEFAKSNRVLPPLRSRWTEAERRVQQAVTATLTLLDKRLGHQVLRDWIERGYFTPNTLFFKLARRLAGLEEIDPPDTTEERFRANSQLVQPIIRYFESFLEQDDLLLRQTSSNSPVAQLTQLIQRISNTGESATDRNIHYACIRWITALHPDLEERSARLRTELANRGDDPDKVDTLETLAYRLQFALTVTLLDRHNRVVFYEWQNRPPTIDDEPPHRRMPAAMLDILPLPPTGRQFGTYYSRHSDSDNSFGNASDNALSLFAYTNIGRCYVLNFHRLLTDFNGQPGPNVLALSGTSYLPDSTRFHVGDVQGVLMPESSAKQAIAESRFRFIPQSDRGNRPIRISGSPKNQKMGLFKEMARSLVGKNGTGHLGQQIQELKCLGENDSCWQDRDRVLLLVNSYDQAKWAADEIRQCWTTLREAVYHLKSNTYDADDELEIATGITEAGALNQADIESFPQTGGKILVAPLNAIGRAFNILNANGKAAFGAVYFLIRPYPHPHDTQAIAQEINRHALDWVNQEDFIAWQVDSITKRAEAVRRLTARYWRLIEQRSYYKTLRDDEELHAFPRRDLAATTAGLIIQAVGRLLRGGVQFHAYFVDAAWAPVYAREKKPDTPRTSLLAAIIDLLCDYVDENSICKVLYQPLVDALVDIENFQWNLDDTDI